MCGAVFAKSRLAAFLSGPIRGNVLLTIVQAGIFAQTVFANRGRGRPACPSLRNLLQQGGDELMLKKYLIPAAIVSAFALNPVLADQSGDEIGDKDEREQQKMGTEQQDQTGTMQQGQTAGTTGSATTDERFDELDRNQDGKLDEEELNVWGGTAAGGTTEGAEDPKRTDRMLQRYDRDGDGAISKEEMEQGPMSGTGTTQ